ncbi:MAG TPA: hypothetical protein VIN08_06435 [Ohtaekwangia sp.]|uniref:hypothetical protein n=1 Tax=Ohtaekwangia sp. TaxID=2066019 RepID=UPI002F924C4E
MRSFLMVALLSGFLLVHAAGYAQENIDALKHIHHFSLGVSGGEFADNSWAGVEISSPGIFHNRVCFRLKGNMHWLEQYKARYNHWARFSTLAASVVVYTNINERARWFFDVGPFFIVPQDKISDRKYTCGISGTGGVEVFVLHSEQGNLSYHFGIGAGYAKGYADKLEDKPCYSNGLIFSNGFRFYF